MEEELEEEGQGQVQGADGKAKVLGKSHETNLCVVLELGNLKNPQIFRAGAVL